MKGVNQTKGGRRMEHKPYQEVKIEGRKYWDYNFYIRNTIYEISVDKHTGELYINEDEDQPEEQREEILDEVEKVCSCCGLKLNNLEIKENEGKCFHCLKGNCELCN